jgi:hypothetical protein
MTQVVDFYACRISQKVFPQSTSGVVSVKVTGEPESFTHRTKGSLPTCSGVAPFWSTTVPGNVTGIGAEQVLPVVLTVTAVVDFPVESKV